MTKARICVPIIDNNTEVSKTIEPDIDWWEIRMDLIGPDWPEVVKKLKKPWIACNRRMQEGGRGQPDESIRIKELLKGLAAGASMVDIELSTPTLNDSVTVIKKQSQCLISYHNYQETPALVDLAEIVARQQKAGADICKIVTTANSFQDNLTLLHLLKQNTGTKMVAFAMGAEGRLSRILSPMAGAYFTFASLESGKESASGQIPVSEMKQIYDSITQQSKSKS